MGDDSRLGEAIISHGGPIEGDAAVDHASAKSAEEDGSGSSGCGGGDSGSGEASGSHEGEEDDGTTKKKKKKGAVPKELKDKMRGEGPKSKILAAMYKKNRPGNVATVEAFTGHKIPKGVVQQVLEELAKSGELSVKDSNGKNKVYWFNQSQFRAKGLNLTKLNAEVEEKQEVLSGLQEERAKLEKSLHKLEAQPSNEDLEGQITELTSRCVRASRGVGRCHFT